MEEDLKEMAASFLATGLGNGRRPEEDGSPFPNHWFGEWKKTFWDHLKRVGESPWSRVSKFLSKSKSLGLNGAQPQ
jgi:hypothetical protein